MFFWAKNNLDPANYVLISGNEDFSYALKKLRKSGHNALLGHPNREASGSLTNDASAVWYWETLLAGGSPLPFSPSWKLTTSDTHAASSSSSSSSHSGPIHKYFYFYYSGKTGSISHFPVSS